MALWEHFLSPDLFSTEKKRDRIIIKLTARQEQVKITERTGLIGREKENDCITLWMADAE